MVDTGDRIRSGGALKKRRQSKSFNVSRLAENAGRNDCADFRSYMFTVMQPFNVQQPADAKTTTQPQITCSVCTLLRSPPAPICGACGARLPAGPQRHRLECGDAEEEGIDIKSMFNRICFFFFTSPSNCVPWPDFLFFAATRDRLRARSFVCSLRALAFVVRIFSVDVYLGLAECMRMRMPLCLRFVWLWVQAARSWRLGRS